MDITVRHRSFKVNGHFAPLFWQDLAAENWESNTFDVLDRFVAPGDCVLDIGSWAGPLSLYLARKGAIVHAIDPDPIAHRELIVNLGLNPDLSQSIRPYQIAICPINDTTTIYARQDYGASSTSILPRARDTKHHIKVPGMTLEKFLHTAKIKHVDFIKMDIESGEFAVFPTLEKLLLQLGLPTVHLSLHYRQLYEHIIRRSIGFQSLSLGLLRLDRILPLRLYRRPWFAHIEKLLPCLKQYAYIYDEQGTPIDKNKLSPAYLLKNCSNLVLSQESW